MTTFSKIGGEMVPHGAVEEKMQKALATGKLDLGALKQLAEEQHLRAAA